MSCKCSDTNFFVNAMYTVYIVYKNVLTLHNRCKTHHNYKNVITKAIIYMKYAIWQCQNEDETITMSNCIK